MEYVPHILGVIALLLAAFTFLKMGGAMARIRALEKRNRKVEEDLKAMKEDSRKGGRGPSQDNNRREPRAGQTTMPPGREPRQGQERQPQQESRQKQPREQAARGQQSNDPRAAQNQPQQPRQPQEPRQKQEPREPQQPKQGREQRQPQEPKTPQEPRQPQEGRQKQPRQPQLDADGQPIARPQQNQRRNEGQRRQPVTEQPQDPNASAQPVNNPSLAGGMIGDDLLNELTQPQAQAQPEVPESRTRFAVIPEDGLVKTHQLQQQPDSDSYLEIDAPAEGSTTTRYRFNVKGNQAFVISQGMDRLENAFEFEKPSNRMVSRIVLQGDGVLTRTPGGWKIQEKARIDFR